MKTSPSYIQLLSDFRIQTRDAKFAMKAIIGSNLEVSLYLIRSLNIWWNQLDRIFRNSGKLLVSFMREELVHVMNRSIFNIKRVVKVGQLFVCFSACLQCNRGLA